MCTADERSAWRNIIVRWLEGRCEKLLGWQQGNEVHMYSSLYGEEGYRAPKGWEKIHYCTVVKRAGCAGVCLKIVQGQMEGGCGEKYDLTFGMTWTEKAEDREIERQNIVFSHPKQDINLGYSCHCRRSNYF